MTADLSGRMPSRRRWRSLKGKERRSAQHCIALQKIKGHARGLARAWRRSKNCGLPVSSGAIYALLISSMIPSLTNLVIGGTLLVRGLPGVPSLLLRFTPERGGVLKWDRHWIAAVLTAQAAAGAALGIAAQALLAVGIIGYVMPFFGLELLDMARGVAALNLPMRAWHLLTHIL